MGTHTPGPWVGFNDQGKLAAIMPAGRTGNICEFSTPPTEGDGNLMIAATDLLAHAKTVVFHLRRGDHQHPRAVSQMIAALEGAIAKAEGSALKPDMGTTK